MTDYHDFTHPCTPKEKRKRLNVGDIYTNGAVCSVCDYFIRSRNRHDMVTCKCGNVSVDGGSMYAKRSCRGQPYREVIVLFDDAKDISI